MKNTAKLLNQKCEYPSKNLPLINSLCPFSCPAQPLLFPDIPEWHPVSWSCSWHWFLPSRPDSSLAWGQRGSRWAGASLATSVTLGGLRVPSPTGSSAWVQRGPRLRGRGTAEWERSRSSPAAGAPSPPPVSLSSPLCAGFLQAFPHTPA